MNEISIYKNLLYIFDMTRTLEILLARKEVLKRSEVVNVVLSIATIIENTQKHIVGDHFS